MSGFNILQMPVGILIIAIICTILIDSTLVKHKQIFAAIVAAVPVLCMYAYSAFCLFVFFFYYTHPALATR